MRHRKAKEMSVWFYLITLRFGSNRCVCRLCSLKQWLPLCGGVCENDDANTWKTWPHFTPKTHWTTLWLKMPIWVAIPSSFCIQEVYFTRIEKSGKWVENESHDIKGSGLEGKNIVTSGQILSVVIAMWLPCFLTDYVACILSTICII